VRLWTVHLTADPDALAEVGIIPAPPRPVVLLNCGALLLRQLKVAGVVLHAERQDGLIEEQEQDQELADVIPIRRS
jgi:hypothetical protein